MSTISLNPDCFECSVCGCPELNKKNLMVNFGNIFHKDCVICLNKALKLDPSPSMENACIHSLETSAIHGTTNCIELILSRMPLKCVIRWKNNPIELTKIVAMAIIYGNVKTLTLFLDFFLKENVFFRSFSEFYESMINDAIQYKHHKCLAKLLEYVSSFPILSGHVFNINLSYEIFDHSFECIEDYIILTQRPHINQNGNHNIETNWILNKSKFSNRTSIGPEYSLSCFSEELCDTLVKCNYYLNHEKIAFLKQNLNLSITKPAIKARS